MSTHVVIWVAVADLSRTGVPIALERMLRWLSTQGPDRVQCHVVAGKDGPLAPQIARSASSLTTLEPQQGRSPVGSVAAAGAVLGAAQLATWPRDHWYRNRVRALPTPNVVLLQGAGAWDTARALEPLWDGARLVLHLHELELALSRSGAGGSDPDLFTRPDAVLAVCTPAAELAMARGASQDRVGLLSGAVDAPPQGWDGPTRSPAGNAVVSMGQAGWRKGIDRAVAAAWELRRLKPGIEWHWIGNAPTSPWRMAVGTADPLIRHGSQPEPWLVVPAPAGLVVTSREDPMPLVVLEAAARAIPVVATRTGGLADLLGSGRGVSVDGPNLAALTAAVQDLIDAPQIAAERARELRRHVRDHYATSVIGPQWLEAILDQPQAI